MITTNSLLDYYAWVWIQWAFLPYRIMGSTNDAAMISLNGVKAAPLCKPTVTE